MFKRIGKAIDIMKACWKVLLLDKELLVFPLLTIVVPGACLVDLGKRRLLRNTLKNCRFIM